MMRRWTVFGMVVVLPLLTWAQASDWEVMGFGTDIHGTVDVQWQSKYIWRGFDVYGDKSALLVSADLDLYNTGFGLSVAGHRANSSGFEKNERWDYCAYYKGSLLPEDILQTNYRVGWVYYNYPHRPNEQMDLQEFQVILGWPSVTGIEGLVPRYALIKLWPSRTGGLGGNASGFAHIFMLDYAFSVPGFFPETPEQNILIHSELVYNDGVSPTGSNVDHDWSNAIIGVSTEFELGYGISLVPDLYYQASMDSSVNTEDEVWVDLGLRYKF